MPLPLFFHNNLGFPPSWCHVEDGERAREHYTTLLHMVDTFAGSAFWALHSGFQYPQMPRPQLVGLKRPSACGCNYPWNNYLNGMEFELLFEWVLEWILHGYPKPTVVGKPEQSVCVLAKERTGFPLHKIVSGGS